MRRPRCGSGDQPCWRQERYRTAGPGWADPSTVCAPTPAGCRVLAKSMSNPGGGSVGVSAVRAWWVSSGPHWACSLFVADGVSMTECGWFFANPSAVVDVAVAVDPSTEVAAYGSLPAARGGHPL